MGDVVSLSDDSATSYKEWVGHSSHLPATLQQGLLRYLDHGIEPGHFLTAVLTNDLFEAIGRADNQSLQVLPDICKFIYNHTPHCCWGSKEKVAKYKKRQKGDAYG